MKIIRRLLTGAALMAVCVLSASADQIATYTSNLSSTPVDITNTAISMTPFQPGVGGVPGDAVLHSFTITLNEGIAGNITITNGAASLQTVTATIDSVALLYLFSPTPSSDLPISSQDVPCDDAFGGPGSGKNVNGNGCSGTDPDAAFTQQAKSLGAGQSAGPFSYNATASSVTSSITAPSSLTAVESAWKVYLDTATTITASASGGNGSATYTDNVSGTVTVAYDYIEVTGTPEPTTMLLFGSALVGLGLIRKRVRNS